VSLSLWKCQLQMISGKAARLGVLSLALHTLPVPPSWAGQLDDGLNAFRDGKYAAAISLLQPFASQGDVRAQYDLGKMYQNGQSVPRDLDTAEMWMRRAAGNNYVPAQYELGFMLSHQGQSALLDESEAAKWYALAASKGDGPAQLRLGEMYLNGRGVAQDFVGAYLWFALAVRTLNPLETRIQGEKNRDALASKMSPERLSEAKRLVSDWKVGTMLSLDRNNIITTRSENDTIKYVNIVDLITSPDGRNLIFVAEMKNPEQGFFANFAALYCPNKSFLSKSLVRVGSVSSDLAVIQSGSKLEFLKGISPTDALVPAFACNGSNFVLAPHVTVPINGVQVSNDDDSEGTFTIGLEEDRLVPTGVNGHLRVSSEHK
jgi:uncharacterized protein